MKKGEACTKPYLSWGNEDYVNNQLQGQHMSSLVSYHLRYHKHAHLHFLSYLRHYTLLFVFPLRLAIPTILLNHTLAA